MKLLYLKNKCTYALIQKGKENAIYICSLQQI